MAATHRFQRGLSLVEALAVIAIAALLLAAGAPAYTNLVQENRLSAQANGLLATLHYARSEAVKRGSHVTVCAASGGACVATSDWAQGWMAFADADGDGILDPGEDLLHRWSAVHPSHSLQKGKKVRVRFDGQGFSAGYNDTFRLCDARGPGYGRSIIVSNQGRVRVAKGASACP